MRKLIGVVALAAAILVGCQEDKPVVDTLDNGVMPQEVTVDILHTEAQSVNEAVTLEVAISQGEKKLDDASVEFEVWESGKRTEGQLIPATLSGDGVYTAQHTFDHEGVYYLYAHTNASGMHIMPKQEIIVGNPDQEAILEDDSSDEMEDMPAHN